MLYCHIVQFVLIIHEIRFCTKHNNVYCLQCCFVGDCGVNNILFRDITEYNLTSSNYPFDYANGVTCHWQIDSGEVGLIVEILDFDLERGYDFLEIGYNDETGNPMPSVASLTGSIKLRMLVFDHGYIWMAFRSDSTGSAEGFALRLIQNMKEVTSGDFHFFLLIFLEILT